MCDRSHRSSGHADIVRDAADHADFIVRRLDGGGRLLVLFDSLFDLVCAYLYNPYIVRLDKNTMKNANVGACSRAVILGCVPIGLTIGHAAGVWPPRARGITTIS